jgi:hypothetical protein
MEQAVLQLAEVASQLLVSLGDGGAEGRRRGVGAVAGGVAAARGHVEPSGPAM